MFKKFTIVVMALVLMMSFTGCFEDGYAQKEEKRTSQNQSKLLSAQPPVSLDWSLERENINNRTNRWNDPNKVSYIYLIDFGKVMAFHTIKGKVSSVNSQITNPEKKVRGGQGNVVLPSPAEDGSYGSNGDAIFFFTTEGVYGEWNGKYLLVDEPLKLSTPPQLVRNIK
jgi:hypothetical protein